MSRIGKLPVAIPSGVDVTLNDGSVAVKGPKGSLQQHIQIVEALEAGDREAAAGLIFQHQRLLNDRHILANVMLPLIVTSTSCRSSR